MPDIAMCSGAGCPLKDSCYRHTAIPTPGRQSYAAFPRKEDGSCDRYWPVEVLKTKRLKIPPKGDVDV